MSANAYAQTVDFLSEDFWKTATIEHVQSAIENDADVNARNKYGYTPLIIAVSKYNSQSNIIEALIKYGADVNARDEDGKTAFGYAKDTDTIIKSI